MEILPFAFVLGVLHVKVRIFTISLFSHPATRYATSLAWLNLGKIIFRLVDTLIAFGLFCFKKAEKIQTDIEKTISQKEK